jgi:hypothetical protein
MEPEEKFARDLTCLDLLELSYVKEYLQRMIVLIEAEEERQKNPVETTVNNDPLPSPLKEWVEGLNGLVD